MWSQQQLRTIIWEIGQRDPVTPAENFIVLNMVHPRLGHAYWHVRQEPDASQQADLILRIYDVTDVVFDSSNAHRFFDIAIQQWVGNYYFDVDALARNYLAEVGLRGQEGAFQALARSAPTFFDRDQPADGHRLNWLFAGDALHQTCPMDNVYHAQSHDKRERELGEIAEPEDNRGQEPVEIAQPVSHIDQELADIAEPVSHIDRELAGIARPETLLIAAVFIDPSLPDSPLGTLIRRVAQVASHGAKTRLFTSALSMSERGNLDAVLDSVQTHSEPLYAQLVEAHHANPFQLLHCHDWYSLGVGLLAVYSLKLPLIFSLHSTEHQRTQGDHELSAAICEREQAGVQAATLVIVPHVSTRQQVITVYGADPEKVVIIPDDLPEKEMGAQYNTGYEIALKRSQRLQHVHHA